MYRLKIDVVGNDYLTTTYDGTITFPTIEEAREAAQVTRNALFEEYSNYRNKGYTVDIVWAGCITDC